MSIATQPTWNDLVPPPVPVRRFTVEEYHRMIEAGFFAEDERFELLDGWIVPKMTRNPPHEVALALVDRLLQRRLPEGWHIRNQSAMTTIDSQPEPDLALVRGEPRDYLDQHPVSQAIALVVEVAESSLAQDRGFKARIYGRAGIPAYWIINLINHRVEVYTDPTGPDSAPGYRRRQDFGAEQAVPLVIDGREIGPIAVGDLLP